MSKISQIRRGRIGYRGDILLGLAFLILAVIESSMTEKQKMTCETCGAGFRSVPSWSRCSYCRHPEILESKVKQALAAGAVIARYRVIDSIGSPQTVESGARETQNTPREYTPQHVEEAIKNGIRLYDLLEAAGAWDSISTLRHILHQPPDERANLFRKAVESGELTLPEQAIAPESEDNSPSTGWERWQKYGEGWPERRKEVLSRDGHRCRWCGISHKEHKDRDDLFPPGKGLHIHHVVPFRKFDNIERANRLENLIALCDSCHRTAH
jgi:hypothetical protein